MGPERVSGAILLGNLRSCSASNPWWPSYLELFISQLKKRARSFPSTIIALDGVKINVAFPNLVIETRQRSQLACGYPRAPFCLILLPTCHVNNILHLKMAPQKAKFRWTEPLELQYIECLLDAVKQGKRTDTGWKPIVTSEGNRNLSH